jgi:hypothetical protein
VTRPYSRYGPLRLFAECLKFADGTPSPLVVLRYGFFVVVGIMIVFGLAPLAERTAKLGIIGCVISIMAIGFLHVVLAHHYVRTGRA